MITILASLALLSNPPIITAMDELRDDGLQDRVSIGGGDRIRVVYLDQTHSSPSEAELMAPDMSTETSRDRILSMVGASPPASQWQVQLGAYESDTVAQSAWTSLTQNHQQLLSGSDPFLQNVETSSGAMLVRLRATGFSDRSSAISTCEALQASGQDCFVTSSG